MNEAAPARRRRTAPNAMARAIQQWFTARGWRAQAFQRDTWRAMAEGDSGLLHAQTGTGKTYAVWFGALAAFATLPAAADAARQASSTRTARGAHAAQTETAAVAPRPRRAPPAPPLTVLWLTPMRALAADTAQALSAPLAELGLDWSVGVRTADTGSAERARQSRRLPTAMITTPESLALALSRADAVQTLSSVRLLVVDEWHELLGNKRGVQTQLAIARLARLSPGLRVWGLSATLGNLEVAAEALLSAVPTRRRLIRGQGSKPIRIDTLMPPSIERFPWSGHLNTRMIAPLAAELDGVASALVFTNTRSQAERWYQALLDARPDWAGLIALHHGSLDKAVREWVEAGLKHGQLRVVVSTSSLDLGVDFAPVERVFQIGSPKGVARLLQRAGRSGHAPGRPSRITLVPTHALELLEAAAARHAAQTGIIESREPPHAPLDVLVQHLATLALGGGLDADAAKAEVRACWSYRDLGDAAFDWAIGFLSDGGAALGAYPDYRRIEPDAQGIWHMPRRDLAQRHRLNIGTIVSDSNIDVMWLSGGRLGSLEEGFVARLRPGDVFLFAGRALQLVRVREMVAYVRRAPSSRAATPRWQGSRMALSATLTSQALSLLDAAGSGSTPDPEMRALAPLLALQQRWSALPGTGRLLVEVIRTREGQHLFCYPFAGRTAHLGMAALFAWRAAQQRPDTFSISVNDYGFELLGRADTDWPALIAKGLFDAGDPARELPASLNASELAKRRFREIARIAGLVVQRYPGMGKNQRQLQASSGLMYEVLRRHDTGNRLLEQADLEVLREELDLDRLREALARIAAGRIDLQMPPRPTPFAFALLVSRMRERVSTETLAERVQRMLDTLEAAAGRSPTPRRRARTTHASQAGARA